MATYKVYFANAGVAATGLSPTWSSLKKLSDGTDESSQPAFTEVGGGWYKYTYSPTEDMVGVIDGSATVTEDTDRYVPVDFTEQDAYLDAAVSTRSTFVAGGNVVATNMRGTDDAAKPSDLTNLSTFDPSSDTVIVGTNQDKTNYQLASGQLNGIATETKQDLAKSAIDSVLEDTSTTIPSLISSSESNIKGTDGDTLKTISDQLDIAQSDLDNPDQFKADISNLVSVNDLTYATSALSTFDSSSDGVNVTQINGQSTINEKDLSTLLSEISIILSNVAIPDPVLGKIDFYDSTENTLLFTITKDPITGKRTITYP